MFNIEVVFRTITNSPEYNLWHIRESADVNTMHSYWHTTLSSEQVTFDLSRFNALFFLLGLCYLILQQTSLLKWWARIFI